jgi:hypothetical protein
MTAYARIPGRSPRLSRAVAQWAHVGLEATAPEDRKVALTLATCQFIGDSYNFVERTVATEKMALSEI